MTELKKGTDFLKTATSTIQKVKANMIRILSKDTAEQIQKKSNNQLSPEISTTKNGFVVYVQKTSDDPNGIHAQEVERSTGAFNKTHQQLSDKSYVESVLKRKA